MFAACPFETDRTYQPFALASSSAARFGGMIAFHVPADAFVQDTSDPPRQRKRVKRATPITIAAASHHAESDGIKNEQQLPSVIRTQLELTKSGILNRGIGRREQRKLCIAIRRGPLPARCGLGRAGSRSGR